MEQIVAALAEHFVFVIIGVIILAGMVVKGVTTVVLSTCHERTRREIAAYVAEGSLTPEQGERLLRVEPAAPGSIRRA